MTTMTTAAGTIAFTIYIDQTVTTAIATLAAQRHAENIRTGTVTHIWDRI